MPGAKDELMFLPLETSKVADQLKRGAILLTASQQLAMDWKRRLISESGHAIYETPVVLTWQAWLRELAIEQASMPVALNHMQENWLWEQVIRADLSKMTALSGQSAASVRGLAGHARDAYALMQEYRIDIGELACAGEEADALMRWIGAVRKQLDDSALCGRMLAADVGPQLLQCMGDIDTPERLLLAGFDVFTPMQQALLSALQGADVRLEQVQDESKTEASTLYVCADVQAECNHIATRVRTVLDEYPQARIAISTSEAVKDTSVLRRAMNDVLMPEYCCDPACAMPAVSMSGDVLSDTPMIRQLLHMLTLAGAYVLSFDECSSLLFSPWLKGFDDEYIGRAELDVIFRRQNRHSMTFKSLLHAADVQALPGLLSALKVLAGWNRHQRPANDWVKAVHELLKQTGFVRLDLDKTGSDKTGSDKTDSDHEVQRSNLEIRQMNAFRDVLISLVAVDAMGESLSWMRFLALLRTGCSEVRLAQAAKYPNVTVMPLTQMAGLQFDHIFVMGLDDEAFPSPVRPYPLLPAGVQKKYALPGSIGTIVYEAAQRLWTSLLRSAPNVEISYARQRDDKEVFVSSFIADLEVHACIALETQPLPLETEGMDDDLAVPLPVGQAVRGGTSVIGNQSACPFRAFATHRLGIAALGETTPGIEATNKGSLIHLALEYIWQKLGRQAALAALDTDETIALVDAAIDHAWTEAYVVADSRTRDYEKKRMRRVLLEWLELELNRPDFRVAATETPYHMQLPELSDHQFKVNIKADRMDVDASGRRILIDYKTGAKQSAAKWLNERIEAPQLPQYALAAGLGVDDAVTFARVRSGDMEYEGLCGEDIGIEGIMACDGQRGRPEDWQTVLDDWKTHINALATEFVEGRCDVSPRDVHACKYCSFEAICRIEEIGQIDE